MILVTGGAGYIGSHAVKQLLDQGYNVIVIDNLSTGHQEAVDKRAVFIKGNIGDFVLLDSIFKQYPIRAVMHFSANCLVGESMLNPLKYYENNVGNTIILLKAMIKHGIRNIIFSSTCATYGITDQEFLDENSPTSPVNPYGKSKLMVEQIIQDFSRVYNMSYIILRYFNVAGADFSGGIGEDHRPETHLIPNILLHLLGKSDSVFIFGNDFDTLDGTCVRDYVHVLDIVNAHIMALGHLIRHPSSEGKTYNLGTNAGYSIKQVINTCEKITNKQASIVVKSRRMGDPPYLVASSAKIQKELGWKSVYSLEDTILSAWNWHKNHPDGYKKE